jgi:hypothetical protein
MGDDMSDDSGRATFARITSEIANGTFHWVARRILEPEPMHPGPLTLEQKRERARTRKARQRMRSRRADDD